MDSTDEFTLSTDGVVTDFPVSGSTHGLLIEPTHVEDEDLVQENDNDDERDCRKSNSRRDVRTNTAHEAWMT